MLSTNSPRWLLALLLAASVGLAGCGGGGGGDDDSDSDGDTDTPGQPDDGGDTGDGGSGDDGGDSGGSGLTSSTVDDVARLVISTGLSARGSVSAANQSTQAGDAGTSGLQTNTLTREAAVPDMSIDCTQSGTLTFQFSDGYFDGNTIAKGAEFALSYDNCVFSTSPDERMNGAMTLTFLEAFDISSTPDERTQHVRADYDALTRTRVSDGREESWVDGALQLDAFVDIGSDSGALLPWPATAGVPAGADTTRGDVTDVESTPLHSRTRLSDGSVAESRLIDAAYTVQVSSTNTGADAVLYTGEYTVESIQPDVGILDVEVVTPMVWTIAADGDITGVQGELRITGPNGRVATIRTLTGADDDTAELQFDGTTQRILWEEFDQL